jgi:predicted MFS family arabinose efflux permease
LSVQGGSGGAGEAPPGARGPATTFLEALSLLRTRRFGTFWFASLLSNTGSWAQLVAQPWLLLSIGATPFLVGLDSFAMDAPVLLLTLVGGVLADRADRRRVITLFQSIQMLCPLALIVLLVTGAVRPWMVICASLVMGLTDALSMPSFQSIVPSIVAHDRIAAGLALNSTQFNLSRILGPAAAGLLMTGIGMVGCYAASAASYLPFILVTWWILPRRTPLAAPADAFEQHHPFAGVREVLRQPQLRGALLTVMATGAFCGPLLTFCPVLVKAAFHGSAAQFSAVIGAFGLGGLIGASALLAVDVRRDRRRISAFFALAYGAVVVAAALDPWFWALPALLVLAGISMSISNTSANTFLLTTADPRLRGRTVSLYMLAMRGGTSLGSLLTGVTVSLLGVQQALLVNGVLALALQLYISGRWLQRPLVQSAPARDAIAGGRAERPPSNLSR